MKPVELEILMKDGLTPGLKRAGQIVRRFSADTSAEMKEVNSRVEEQRKHIKRLETSLKELEKTAKNATPGAAWSDAQKKVNALKKELEEEKTALEGLVEEQEKLKAASEGADTSLRTQLRNITQEVASLMVAYAELSEEERNSAEGKALKQHMDELIEKAGVLRDAMADTTDAIKNSASDTRAFDQMAAGVQLVIDSFGMATASAEMLGVSQEDLVEIQTKLQAALIASNALSSIQANLQRQSALMQGVLILQTKAAAVAENIKTAAQGKGIIATKAATIAQAAFNVVAKANPYVLLAMSVVTVVGALYAFAKGSKAAQKAEEERQAAMAKSKEENEEIARAIGDTAGAQISAYSRLQRAWKALGDDMAKRKKFVDENKKAFQELGLSVNNVKDAEAVLVSNTEDVVKSFVLRAKAAALDKAVTDTYSKMIERQETARRNMAPVSKKKGDEVSYADANAVGMTGVKTVPHDHTYIRAGTGIEKSWTTYTYEVTDAASYNAAVKRNAERKRDEEIEKAREEADARVLELQDEIGATEAELSALKIPQLKNTPNTPISSSDKKDNRVQEEQRIADELKRLRYKNEEEDIEQEKDAAEKKRRQIRLDYDKRIDEIDSLEAKWREAQNGNVTQEQSDELLKARELASKEMSDGLKQVEADEVAKQREKLDELLEQYKNYDQRRRDIDESYKTDKETLEAEIASLTSQGKDTSEVEATLAARTDTYKNSIKELESEILRSSDFYDKLFGNVSEKGYKVLKDFYAQAKQTLEEAKVSGDGVEITVPVKDADGKFVRKAVKVTVDEYRKMQKQVNDIRKELEKNNPFGAFRTAWSQLRKEIKDNGDVQGALKNLQSKGKEVTQTIRGWGDALGSVFGDNFKNSMNEIMNFCDGAMDMGTGIAQIWSGDIVGGITNTLNGLSSIVSMFTSWKEKMEEMKREWYIAEIETNRTIRNRQAEYAANRSEISDIIKDVETLNWLIKNGYAKEARTSVWEAQSAELDEYMQNLKAESAIYNQLWAKLQGSEGHYEWGNSLNGGSNTWSLRGFSAEQIELWYNQNKLSDEAKAYYEAWVASGKSVEELTQNIEKAYGTMREMVMGVSFDSFLSNAKDALKAMRSDISKLGDFTESTLQEAILNGFMYKDLAKVLEPLYNELSENLINGTADEDYLRNWKQRLEDTLKAANDRLDAVAEAAGVDIDSGSGSSQSGKSGGFTAMTQDQGTKLEGMFTSGLQHWSSIDDKLETVVDRMSVAEGHLAQIAENTGMSAGHLGQIKEEIKKIVRDGLKMK